MNDAIVTGIEIDVNGQQLRVPLGATVEDLLDQLQLAKRGIAVELNQQIVPRQRHPKRQLRPGDQVEIVTLVGGG